MSKELSVIQGGGQTYDRIQLAEAVKVGGRPLSLIDVKELAGLPSPVLVKITANSTFAMIECEGKIRHFPLTNVRWLERDPS
jgi:hypothetical protein